METNTPNYTHTVVMIVDMFVRKDNQYLMLRRSEKKTVLPGYLHTVGGKIELGESPYDAAIRELYEEANLSVTNIRLAAFITEIPPKHHAIYKETWLIFYFLGEYLSGEIKQTDEGELLWLTKEEIMKEKIFPSLKEILPFVFEDSTGPVFARFTYNENLEITHKVLHLCEK